MSPWHRSALAALVLGLAGCTMTVENVDLDASRLVISSAKRLECPRPLVEVVDARPEHEGSGGLGERWFRFEDAAAVVRRSLLEAGFTDAGATTDGVRVRIMRLYMAQHHVTKIPVAVYEVTPGTAAPFLIRSQPANMNWNGTENEAYAGYSRAIEGANQQLIERLNADCKR